MLFPLVIEIRFVQSVDMCLSANLPCSRLDRVRFLVLVADEQKIGINTIAGINKGEKLLLKK